MSANLVRFECPGCNSVLKFDPATVRPHDKCPKCELEIDVVSVHKGQQSEAAKALMHASPQEIVQELSRRKKAAVLVYFDPPEEDDFSLTSLRHSNMQCVRSGELEEQQLFKVFAALGKLSDLKQKTGIELSTGQQSEPFDFKGDRLGISMEEFRQKHARSIPGSPQPLPWFSHEATGQTLNEFLAEPWQAAAGIVHARIDLPFEDSPTIAGVQTDRLIYQFVDERLFGISIWFDTEQFSAVSEAMIGKYGQPASQRSNPHSLIWENLQSSIELTMASIRPKKPSTVHFTHTELAQIAASRRPNYADDV